MPNPERGDLPQWMSESNLVSRTAEIARDQGTYTATRYYLESLNLVPKFIKKSDEADFGQSREHLATKAGLVIANHPGNFDTPSILSQIDRRNIKIFANRKRIAQLEIFGSDLFLPAAKKPGELRHVLDRTKEHIEAGGLMLIYPTGGQQGANRSNRGFQSGFRSIVQRLKPDDMIYSFFVSPIDVTDALSQMPPGTLHRLDNPQEIKIDEAYSEAAEWQEVIKNSAKDDVNRNLTRHFLQKFSRERFD